MNINEFQQKLDYLANNFNVMFTDVIQLRINKDFVGSIRNRVEQRSEKATGGLFSTYSPKTLAYKQSKGKKNVNKNFNDSGDMWRSFGIKQRTETKEGTLFTIRMSDGMRNTGNTNQEIAEKHSAIEGISIIDPSEGEIKVVTVMAKKEALKIIKETLT